MNTNQQIEEAKKVRAELDAVIAAAGVAETIEKITTDAQALVDAFKAAFGKPPVTGRPFMKGVKEPIGPGTDVWVNAFDTVAGKLCRRYSFGELGESGLFMLKAGILYPTEQDCIEGNLRDEICKRYAAMGRQFKPGQRNVSAYWTYNRECVSFITYEQVNNGAVCFDTALDCESAISAIDAEYGPGSFVRYCLGVNING